MASRADRAARVSQKPTPYHKCGAQAAAVEVDPLTGQVRVVRFVVPSACSRR